MKNLAKCYVDCRVQGLHCTILKFKQGLRLGDGHSGPGSGARRKGPVGLSMRPAL